MSATYCETHDLVLTDGLTCPACSRAQLRDQVNVLEARISDQGQEIMDLRRQVNELRQMVQCLQINYTWLAEQLP